VLFAGPVTVMETNPAAELYTHDTAAEALDTPSAKNRPNAAETDAMSPSFPFPARLTGVRISALPISMTLPSR